MRATATPLTPPGPVTRALLGWFMRPARVAGVETLSPHFRLVDLEGEALKDIIWTAGQKIQISMGSGLSTRTYTPMSWDIERGRTQILAFTHGDGPGSRWASSLGEGDTCQFLGPRRSLDLPDLGSPSVMFGDETSFGLSGTRGDRPGAISVFEVSDIAESQAVLAAIGLDQAIVMERTAGDAHLAAVETELSRLAASGAHFVLTGKASSIQRVIRVLKAVGVGSSRIRTKAYWAPGKTGLD